MKNNLDYYRHHVNSHNHWKFKLLRKEYGWAGEGKFWALNNEIAASDNCILDLCDEGKKMSIAIDLDFDSDSFNNYLLFLSTKCKLITIDSDRITTKITQETLGEVSKDRERKREWIKSKREQERSIGLKVAATEHHVDGNNSNVDIYNSDVSVENEQSKVKESKVNNSINNGANAPNKNTRKLFIRPTILEVENYIRTKTNDHYNSREVAQNFLDFYDSKGWKVGKTPMIDWQAAVRGCIKWEKNQALLSATSNKQPQLTIVDMDEYLNRPKVKLPF